MRTLEQRRRRMIAMAVLCAGMSLTAATTTASMQPDPASRVERILLTAGRSIVLEMDFPVTRVAVTDPVIADVTVVAPREILVDGKTPGSISLFVWGAGERREYAIVVEPGVPRRSSSCNCSFQAKTSRSVSAATR